MKMRPKRDQRPLLTQEAPILSDQMDPPSDVLADEEDFRHQSKSHKKRSWRRLFGKGGSNNKRKENHNSQGSVEGSLPSFSQSSSSDTGDHSMQKQEPHIQPSRRPASPRQQSDKRDDVTETSHIKVTTTATTPSEYSNSQHTKTFPSARSSMNQSHLSSPATTTTSLAAKSAVTQQHRNHISPRQLSVPSSATARSANSRSVSTSRRTVTSSHSALENMRKMNRAASSSGAAGNAVANKILSRPFGREHVLTTEQTVSLVPK
jgi:hypothetical protein